LLNKFFNESNHNDDGQRDVLFLRIFQIQDTKLEPIGSNESVGLFTLLVLMGIHRNEQYIKDFGEHLKKLRHARSLTQEELSYRCGLPLSQIGRIERGVRSPTLSTILILAEGLGVEPKKLFDFDF
jgi:DNA-binding XRE family transcriptional regulator